MKSTTVKSYVSAIKKTLVEDGYQWEDQKVLLGSLTNACKLVNDKVKTRLPIHCSLLEMILFEVQRMFNQNGQQYVQLLYKTLFALAYYGLMRACELAKTTSNHYVRAKDIHLATNKDKLQLVLYTSKTHHRDIRPQKINITANQIERTGNYAKRHFCPFKLTKMYKTCRGDYSHEEKQFLIFRDRSSMTADHARNILRTALTLSA